jgi:hypothetical protein
MWKTTKTKGGDAACALPRRDFLPRRTICFALLFLCLLAYRGVLDNWLFNDDFSWLRAARLEMTARNLLAYRVVDFFRPLVNLSFWLMEKASPGNVPLHYGFNILLHALCAILYFHLLAKLLGNDRLSLAAAALFAVTSVHAAAVLWISARTTLLSTVFLLAALRALLSERRAGAIRIAGACGLYALALASKEEAIAGLLLAALIFALARRRPGAPRIDGRALATLASISALYLIVRHAFLGGSSGRTGGSARTRSGTSRADFSTSSTRGPSSLSSIRPERISPNPRTPSCRRFSSCRSPCSSSPLAARRAERSR